MSSSSLEIAASDIEGILSLKFLARSHEYLDRLVALRLHASLLDGFKLVKQVAEAAETIASTVTAIVLSENVNNALIEDDKAVTTPKKMCTFPHVSASLELSSADWWAIWINSSQSTSACLIKISFGSGKRGIYFRQKNEKYPRINKCQTFL
jgi:hypothetical protein